MTTPRTAAQGQPCSPAAAVSSSVEVGVSEERRSSPVHLNSAVSSHDRDWLARSDPRSLTGSRQVHHRRTTFLRRRGDVALRASKTSRA